MIMNKQIALGLVLALGLTGLPALAEQPLSLQMAREGGTIEYLNRNALEIGIGGKLFKLDSGFLLHGLPGKDRVQKLLELRQGMNVTYKTTGGSNDSGMISELWVQPD
jgi:hypothetical protein